MSRTGLIALVTLAALATAAEAQRIPRRPRLAAGADTNDAIGYFQLGLARAERNPEEAAAAFYWAGRLDPASPQTRYARSVVALLIGDPQRLVRWVRRDERTLRSPAILAIDSLRLQAEMQDPFLHRGMDEILLMAYAKNATPQDDFVNRSTAVGTAGLVAATERYLEQEDPALRGLLYYSRNQLHDAQQYWAIAMRARDVGFVWADRGRAFYEQRQADSALAGYRNALRFSRRDADPLHLYESRAAWQYAIGRILEDRRDLAGARDAYEHAFAEDEAYYPAMLRLGLIALQTGDTAGALGALARATVGPQVQFFALTTAATVLSSLQRTDRSLPMLRRATEVEPMAAAGWLLLGRELVNARDTTGAIAAFERYLALAPRNDVSRASTAQVLGGLRR